MQHLRMICLLELNGLSIYCLSILAVCGGELNMESGQLESPNYPEDYVPNKECIWVITVPIGFQVALKFQSFEVYTLESQINNPVQLFFSRTFSLL